MSNAVVNLSNVCKQYGKTVVLDKITLSVPKNKIFGLLGENGAGKTTLMRCILGLQRHSSGDITVLDEKVQGINRPNYMNVSGTIEQPGLHPDFTASEILNHYSRLYSHNRLSINKILDMVGLPAKDKKIKHFSQGMKQRLNLGIALLGDPQLILLDEPTNGLDPKGIRELRDMILELPKQLGATVIVSSHLLSELQRIVTDIAIISKGNLLFTGTIEDIKNTYTMVRLPSTTIYEDVLSKNKNLYSHMEVRSDIIDILIAKPKFQEFCSFINPEDSMIVGSEYMLEFFYFSLLDNGGFNV